MLSLKNCDIDLLNDFLFAVSLCHCGDRVLRTKQNEKEGFDPDYKFKSIYPGEEA